jgi:hypothetical protein
MYKKRIKLWGFSKHVKAKEKDKVIAKVVQGTARPNSIRPDKLVRYAKSRVKSGSLSSSNLKKIQKSVSAEASEASSDQNDRELTPRRPSTLLSRSAGTSIASTSIFSPSSPPAQPYEHFELFLKSMQAVIWKERIEYLQGPRRRPDTIFAGLSAGLVLWRQSNGGEAVQLFRRAAQNFNDDLQQRVVARIAYCISSIVWGSIHEDLFMGFAAFMAKAAMEKLGPRHPLTIILQQLHELPSIEQQRRIWDCALDGYELSQKSTTEEIDHWFNMAQRRWRWCKHSGLHDYALQHRDEALLQLKKIGQLTVEREVETQQDFEGLEHFAAATDST